MSSKIDEQILRAAKEIVVKFIEVGRVSPANLPDFFKTTYNAVYSSVKETDEMGGGGGEKKNKG